MAPRVEITQLVVYPLKGGRGVEVNQAKIGENGFENDRRWIITSLKAHSEVPDTYRMVSAKAEPKIWHITPQLPEKGGPLRLSGEGMPDIAVPIVKSKEYKVDVYGSMVRAHDQGDGAAKWVQQFLKTEKDLRVMYFPGDWERAVGEVPTYTAKRDQGYQCHAAFADQYPYLMASEEGLDALNADLRQKVLDGGSQEDGSHPLPLSMQRFRPNIVVKGGGSWVEDTWKEVKIGGVQFRMLQGCVRCGLTATDPITTEKMPNEAKANPREYLWDVRNWGRGGIFGQHAATLTENVGMSIKKGQVVEVLQTRSQKEMELDRGVDDLDALKAYLGHSAEPKEKAPAQPAGASGGLYPLVVLGCVVAAALSR